MGTIYVHRRRFRTRIYLWICWVFGGFTLESALVGGILTSELQSTRSAQVRQTIRIGSDLGFLSSCPTILTNPFPFRKGFPHPRSSRVEAPLTYRQEAVSLLSLHDSVVTVLIGAFGAFAHPLTFPFGHTYRIPLQISHLVAFPAHITISCPQ